MRLVVGLGNPGERYRRTRHNVGFLVVDALAALAGAARGEERAEAHVASAVLGGEEALLVKPLTFMNRSGAAVERLVLDHALLPRDLVVVVDDVALELGRLRVRERGSHGGHNGLRSIIDELGNEKFSRLRIGIGDPVRHGRDHVLSTFAPDETQRLDELLDAAADAVEAWARDGTSKAANRFNTFELRPADTDRLAAPGEVDGPPDASGVRRTKTGWRRMLPGKKDDGFDA